MEGVREVEREGEEGLSSGGEGEGEQGERVGKEGGWRRTGPDDRCHNPRNLFWSFHAPHPYKIK